MPAQHIIKINLPGGYVSAGDFYEMLTVAEDAGAQHIRFGNRQQMYFTVDSERLDDMQTDMLRSGIEYEIDGDAHPNIVSSYVCDTIFSQESWLKEGVYRDIFDMFNYEPRLKINITDSHQTFVPLFSGNLNFVSAEVSNYWYLYIRFPKTSQYYCWPLLIYTDDIPVISKKAEELIFKKKTLFYDKPDIDTELFRAMLYNETDLPGQAITEPLQLPDFSLPYYEGFNRYANKYWLGIYRRNELFSISFLKDVCNLCIKNRIGHLYTTPWKSIIIKGIDLLVRSEWGAILDKHRLNIRHASNELNWQVEDLSAEGLALKQQLVREFEEADLRTYRLSFAIKTRPKTGLTGAVIIKSKPNGKFAIQHTSDFNPNSKDYINYKNNVNANQLAGELITLCHTYYTRQINAPNIQSAHQTAPQEVDITTETAYQCRYCKTVYDSNYGDAINNIAAGTAFDMLDNSYTCPVCESAKDSFVLVEKRW